VQKLTEWLECLLKPCLSFWENSVAVGLGSNPGLFVRGRRLTACVTHGLFFEYRKRGMHAARISFDHCKLFWSRGECFEKKIRTLLHGVNNITIQLPVKAQVLLPNYVRIKEQQCCLSTCFIKHTIRNGSKTGIQTVSTVWKISRRQNFILLHFTCFTHL